MANLKDKGGRLPVEHPKDDTDTEKPTSFIGLRIKWGEMSFTFIGRRLQESQTWFVLALILTLVSLAVMSYVASMGAGSK